jgi:hypothetical protein
MNMGIDDNPGLETVRPGACLFLYQRVPGIRISPVIPLMNVMVG